MALESPDPGITLPGIITASLHFFGHHRPGQIAPSLWLVNHPLPLSTTPSIPTKVSFLTSIAEAARANHLDDDIRPQQVMLFFTYGTDITVAQAQFPGQLASHPFWVPSAVAKVSLARLEISDEQFQGVLEWARCLRCHVFVNMDFLPLLRAWNVPGLTLGAGDGTGDGNGNGGGNGTDGGSNNGTSAVDDAPPGSNTGGQDPVPDPTPPDDNSQAAGSA
jgi:hypothetical protein